MIGPGAGSGIFENNSITGSTGAIRSTKIVSLFGSK